MQSIEQYYNIIAIYLYKYSLYTNIRMIGKIFKYLTNGKNGEKVDKTISSNDRIVNNLLLLRLIGETNDFGKLEHQLKVQKLVFLIQKNFVQRKVPDHIWETHTIFHTCSQCQRIYWPGSHIEHSLDIIKKIFDS